jgi:hypothetical protein
MVGHFYPHRLRLTIKDLNTGPTDPSATPLWATTHKRPPGSVDYTGGTTTVGTMTLTPDQRVVKPTGKLFPYTLSVAMQPTPARTLTRSATWQAVSDPAGASFEYRTETATGSGPFSAPLAGPSTTDPLTQRLRDGSTVCASARAHHPVNGLTTGWSQWRCVTAPYDDRALVPQAGKVHRSHRAGYFHGTTTELSSTGASVTGTRVSPSTALITVGARVSSTGGGLSAYVGSHLVDRWSLQSTHAHRVWHRIDTEGRSGTVVLKKTAAGSVVLDGLEVRKHP